MNLRKYKILLSLLMVISITGCATYYNKTFQKISIHTGVENVKCILETEKSKYIVLAPDVVDVNRSPYDMRILCEKAGYLPSTKVVSSELSVAYFDRNIFGGFIPATMYDFASNAVYHYPEIINMSMELDPNRVIQKEEKAYKVRRKAAPVKPVLKSVTGYKTEYASDSVENAEYVRVQEAVSESAKK